MSDGCLEVLPLDSSAQPKPEAVETEAVPTDAMRRVLDAMETINRPGRSNESPGRRMKRKRPGVSGGSQEGKRITSSAGSMGGEAPAVVEEILSSPEVPSSQKSSQMRKSLNFCSVSRHDGNSQSSGRTRLDDIDASPRSPRHFSPPAAAFSPPLYASPSRRKSIILVAATPPHDDDDEPAVIPALDSFPSPTPSEAANLRRLDGTSLMPPPRSTASEAVDLRRLDAASLMPPPAPRELVRLRQEAPTPVIPTPPRPPKPWEVRILPNGWPVPATPEVPCGSGTVANPFVGGGSSVAVGGPGVPFVDFACTGDIETPDMQRAGKSHLTRLATFEDGRKASTRPSTNLNLERMCFEETPVLEDCQKPTGWGDSRVVHDVREVVGLGPPAPVVPVECEPPGEAAVAPVDVVTPAMRHNVPLKPLPTNPFAPAWKLSGACFVTPIPPERFEMMPRMPRVEPGVFAPVEACDAPKTSVLADAFDTPMLEAKGWIKTVLPMIAPEELTTPLLRMEKNVMREAAQKDMAPVKSMTPTEYCLRVVTPIPDRELLPLPSEVVALADDIATPAGPSAAAATETRLAPFEFTSYDLVQEPSEPNNVASASPTVPAPPVPVKATNDVIEDDEAKQPMQAEETTIEPPSDAPSSEPAPIIGAPSAPPSVLSAGHFEALVSEGHKPSQKRKLVPQIPAPALTPLLPTAVASAARPSNAPDWTANGLGKQETPQTGNLGVGRDISMVAVKIESVEQALKPAFDTHVRNVGQKPWQKRWEAILAPTPPSPGPSPDIENATHGSIPFGPPMKVEPGRGTVDSVTPPVVGRKPWEKAKAFTPTPIVAVGVSRPVAAGMSVIGAKPWLKASGVMTQQTAPMPALAEAVVAAVAPVGVKAWEMRKNKPSPLANASIVNSETASTQPSPSVGLKPWEKTKPTRPTNATPLANAIPTAASSSSPVGLKPWSKQPSPASGVKPWEKSVASNPASDAKPWDIPNAVSPAAGVKPREMADATANPTTGDVTPWEKSGTWLSNNPSQSDALTPATITSTVGTQPWSAACQPSQDARLPLPPTPVMHLIPSLPGPPTPSMFLIGAKPWTTRTQAPQPARLPAMPLLPSAVTTRRGRGCLLKTPHPAMMVQMSKEGETPVMRTPDAAPKPWETREKVLVVKTEPGLESRGGNKPWEAKGGGGGPVGAKPWVHKASVGFGSGALGLGISLPSLGPSSTASPLLDWPSGTEMRTCPACDGAVPLGGRLGALCWACVEGMASDGGGDVGHNCPVCTRKMPRGVAKGSLCGGCTALCL
ncbi:hypothetical protein HK101_010650 [Irineochytrium annulatum]|nr:hypothetical protein HK101_010650 [Irineochytrium annulatum]